MNGSGVEGTTPYCAHFLLRRMRPVTEEIYQILGCVGAFFVFIGSLEVKSSNTFCLPNCYNVEFVGIIATYL